MIDSIAMKDINGEANVCNCLLIRNAELFCALFMNAYKQ